MTKQQLAQYIDMQAEIDDNIEKIAKIKKDIRDLEDNINKIIEEGTVIDKVSGGDGGKQGFKIEGFPYPEYNSKLNRLREKKARLTIWESELEVRQEVVVPSVKEVHDFMYSINDPHVRRIIMLRFEKGFTWKQVANAIGGGNTEDSVRKVVERFLKD